MTSSTNNDDDETQAAALRQQGNEAFRAEDWIAALRYYRDSVALHPSAKAYGNLAATLCHLGQDAQAAAAAARATELEPDWAKGWWRRGVVAQRRRHWGHAHLYFGQAAALSRDEQVFQQAQRGVEQKLVVCCCVNSSMPRRKEDEPRRRPVGTSPAVEAWHRFCHDNPDRSVEVYEARQLSKNNDDDDHPHHSGIITTEQWLVRGVYEWGEGLRDAVANLCVSLDPDCRRRYQRAVGRYGHDHEALHRELQPLIGWVPNNAVQGLTCGVATLGGVHMYLQAGAAPPNVRAQTLYYLCPQPTAVQNHMGYQQLAVTGALINPLAHLLQQFGPQMPVSKAILDGVRTFLTNARDERDSLGGRAASPEEVVAFMKKQLQNKGDAVWSEGLRVYAALMYRGTILYAVFVRLVTNKVLECYQFEKWAHQFIDLADKEFLVTQEGSFAQKGSTFRHSFRLGMMQSELRSLHMLIDGDNAHIEVGEDALQQALDLCRDIVHMAERLEIERGPGKSEYEISMEEAAFRRKPLALAHSMLGANLCTLGHFLSPEDQMRVASDYPAGSDTVKTDIFAVVSEHYRQAAQLELLGSSECVVYWYACGSAMVHVSEEPYTIGDLRKVLAHALKAELELDAGVCNPETPLVESNEAMVVLLVEHFKEKPDSFPLPKVVASQKGKKTRLETADGEQIAENMNNFKRKKHLDIARIAELIRSIEVTEVQ